MKYVKGIFGGFVFGLLASIPWVLLYVYGGWMIAYLAFPIAYGVNYGYKLFKGRVDKYLPKMIWISSIIIMLVVNLIVIPLLLLSDEGATPNYNNLKLIYEYGYLNDIMMDLIISLVFTIIGIAGVINKANEEVGIKPRRGSYDEIRNKFELNKQKIRVIFSKYEAFDKYNTIGKDELRDIYEDKELKAAFNNLRIQTIVRKKGKKYYFSNKADESAMYRFFTLYGKIMLYVLIFTVLCILFFGVFS